MSATKQTASNTAARLVKEVGRVASALEKQNSVKKRLLLGVVFGVGTAIGASIIASLIILILSQTLRVFGVDTSAFNQDAANTIEQQTEIQTPQD
ncbi:hypothetical protein COV06_00450 [Candidatus Uhrbacteria bacterium CG10_big_fil_rev_8_21_14_0_10_50_16]|uniref:Uncharacterized protein n=1 Tax=Candidatus Uhrbacteria bacterium CG10_big_fil_rev_8_21_14_0_10_50_16 TaxID=1975039 RepID=A0A2H0RMT2_9BACT|nr:MAG: hypothetical protein COV06_00450 [Candidatus Uhrbacteria bacterium CG10_big_fil_rev_8_21_14_0_10_50_16]